MSPSEALGLHGRTMSVLYAHALMHPLPATSGHTSSVPFLGEAGEIESQPSSRCVPGLSSSLPPLYQCAVVGVRWCLTWCVVCTEARGSGELQAGEPGRKNEKSRFQTTYQRLHTGVPAGASATIEEFPSYKRHSSGSAVAYVRAWPSVQEEKR